MVNLPIISNFACSYCCQQYSRVRTPRENPGKPGNLIFSKYDPGIPLEFDQVPGKSLKTRKLNKKCKIPCHFLCLCNELDLPKSFICTAFVFYCKFTFVNVVFLAQIAVKHIRFRLPCNQPQYHAVLYESDIKLRA